jgi:hypothetical protein
MKSEEPPAIFVIKKSNNTELKDKKKSVLRIGYR